MSFNTNADPAEYTASSGQTVFPFTFKVFNDTDIKVYKTPIGNTASDEDDILTLSADYEVTIDGDSGGNVTLLSGATSGDKITVLRDLPIDRDIEYQTNGDLLANTLNEDQNYQTYVLGDLSRKVQKVIKFPESAQGLDGTLPNPSPSNYLRWNDTGTAVENDLTSPAWATEAEASAATATTQAGIATAQADIATAKAQEASDSADLASTFTPSAYMTTTPTLSGASSVIESADLVVTITNYNPLHAYTITTTSGTAVRVGDTITITAGSVEADTAHSMSVIAYVDGYLNSPTVTYNFTVLQTTDQPDTDYSIAVASAGWNSSSYPTVDGAIVDGNMTATADNAVATSAPYTKADAEGDWVAADIGTITSELPNRLTAGLEGDELVENGTFDTDIIGWDNTGTGSLAWSSGQIVITRGALSPVAHQALTTDIGKTYSVTMNTTSNTGLYIGTTSGGSNLFPITILNGAISINFTATTTTSHIHFYASTNPSTIYVDNVSVKEQNVKANSTNMLLQGEVIDGDKLYVGNGTDEAIVVASGVVDNLDGTYILPHNQAFTPTYACSQDNVSVPISFDGGVTYDVADKSGGVYVSGAGTSLITYQESLSTKTATVSGSTLIHKVEQKEAGTITTDVNIGLVEAL